MFMKIREKKNLLIIPLFTIIFLLVNMFRNKLFSDELWNFSFSFNLVNGYVPYKDFNMIITPLYPLVCAVIMKIFGNNYLTYMVVNSLIGSLIVYYSMINKEKFLVVVFIILFSFPITYNAFILLLYYILIKYDDNDKLSGLIVGLIFLTKQSVGFLFFLVMIIFSKNRLKRLLYFLIPVVIFVLHLILTDSLKDFIDLAILGLFDFGSKNVTIKPIFLILYLVLMIFLIYLCFKSKFKDKKILYLIVLQSIAVPIFDMYHILIATVPIWNYVFKKVNSLLLNAFTITVIIVYSIYLIDFNNVPNSSKYYKYRNLGTPYPYVSMLKYLKEQETDNLIFITSRSTFFKTELELKPERFDIPLNGNLGYNGSEKFIKYIDKKCVDECFIILSDDNWQIDEKTIEHVENNYTLVNKAGSFYFYTNKK